MRQRSMGPPFDDFVVTRGPALVRFAHALSGDRHLAEDLVQDVLVKAYRRWKRLDNPEAYLRTAICHELISWRRRRSHHEQPTQIPETASHRPVDLVDEHNAAWAMLQDLPFRQRAVLVLRYWEALPDRQIADLLGCAEGTVRSSASRAFAVLRRHPDLAHLLPAEATR